MSRPTEDGYYWLKLEGAQAAVVVLVHSGRVFFPAGRGDQFAVEDLVGNWQKVQPPRKGDWE